MNDNGDAPDWAIELLAAVLEFEEHHDTLYYRGELVSYRKPVEGTGTPEFTAERGYLAERKADCLAGALLRIPPEAVQAAHWYTRGKKAVQP